MGTQNEQINELNVLTELLDSKNKYRKVVQAAVADWIKRFQNGDIKADTVEDLRTLIQIELELQRNIANDRHRIERIRQ